MTSLMLLLLPEMFPGWWEELVDGLDLTFCRRAPTL